MGRIWDGGTNQLDQFLGTSIELPRTLAPAAAGDTGRIQTYSHSVTLLPAKPSPISWLNGSESYSTDTHRGKNTVHLGPRDSAKHGADLVLYPKLSI